MNTILSLLIICGFLYLSLVTWLFRRKDPDRTADSGLNRREGQPSLPVAGPLSIVPQSRFNMEDFQKSLSATMASAIRQAMSDAMNGMGQSASAGMENEDGCSEDDTYEDEEENPSMDDVDPGRVSPPARGDTIEEIEDALSVAVSPDSTPVQKAEAGRILAGMRDVGFIGKMMEADKRISDGVMDCIAESIRMKKESRHGRRGNTVPKAKARPVEIGGVLRDPDFIKHKKDDDEET